jgi:DNA-binding MarR family transcriptional regulator
MASGQTNDQVLTLMFEVGRIMRHAMVARDSMPLSLSSGETLRFIEERGSPTMRDIAAYLRISAPSATGIVEELAAERYIVRKPDAKDRRIVRLALSGKGRALLARTTRIRTKALKGLTKPLSARDRKEFIRLLSKIVSEA